MKNPRNYVRPEMSDLGMNEEGFLCASSSEHFSSTPTIDLSGSVWN